MISFFTYKFGHPHVKHAGQRSSLAIKLFLEDVTIIGVKEIIDLRLKQNTATPSREPTEIQQLAKNGKHMPQTKAV